MQPQEADEVAEEQDVDTVVEVGVVAAEDEEALVLVQVLVEDVDVDVATALELALQELEQPKTDQAQPIAALLPLLTRHPLLREPTRRLGHPSPSPLEPMLPFT